MYSLIFELGLSAKNLFGSGINKFPCSIGFAVSSGKKITLPLFVSGWCFNSGWKGVTSTKKHPHAFFELIEHLKNN